MAMVSPDTLERYHRALMKIKPLKMLALPEDVKKVLRDTTDLEIKTVMVEEIVKRRQQQCSKR